MQEPWKTEMVCQAARPEFPELPSDKTQALPAYPRHQWKNQPAFVVQDHAAEPKGFPRQAFPKDMHGSRTVEFPKIQNRAGSKGKCSYF